MCVGLYRENFPSLEGGEEFARANQLYINKQHCRGCSQFSSSARRIHIGERISVKKSLQINERERFDARAVPRTGNLLYLACESVLFRTTKNTLKFLRMFLIFVKFVIVDFKGTFQKLNQPKLLVSDPFERKRAPLTPSRKFFT